jgi:hypothetical protein
VQPLHKNRDLKEQLRLGSERTCGRIFRKALVLEIVKRRVEPSVRIRKMNVRTLWRGQSPPKRKKRPLYNSRLNAMDVGALISLEIYALTDRKSRMMVVHLDRLAPYQAAAPDERP